MGKKKRVKLIVDMEVKEQEREREKLIIGIEVKTKEREDIDV